MKPGVLLFADISLKPVPLMLTTLCFICLHDLYTA